MSRQEWRQRAACRDTVDDRAFGTSAEQEQFINEFCRHCPVRVECGTFGMQMRAFGVFGGMSARQRRARLKAVVAAPRRARRSCGTNATYVRHLRHGETPCSACRAARSEYSRRQYERRRVA